MGVERGILDKVNSKLFFFFFPWESPCHLKSKVKP